MKAYLHMPGYNLSNCFRRIKDAISKHVKIVKEKDADIVIILAIGPDSVKKFDLPTVLWQLTYLTSGGQEAWVEKWKEVDFVTSYLRLPIDYLRMPLGYDPNMFYVETDKKAYDALTTGYLDGERGEYISDVIKIFDSPIHIGGKIDTDSFYIHQEKISDEEMREAYNRTKYTFSLREYEGFELPIVEAAACGSVPIYLDMECYDVWFNDIGISIKLNEISNIKNLSDELYTFKRNKALKNIKEFTWENVFNKYNFIKELENLI